MPTLSRPRKAVKNVLAVPTVPPAPVIAPVAAAVAARSLKKNKFLILNISVQKASAGFRAILLKEYLR